MSDITSQQLVVFSLGAEEYALPIGAVHEIIRFTEPRAVSSDTDWIRGVIGLRGKIIPIFDLAARMGLLDLSAEPGKIVIVETGSGLRAARRGGESAAGGGGAPGGAGVIVYEVDEVITVTSDQLEDVPSAS